MTIRVSILGHASALIEIGEKQPTRVVIDPIFADTFGSDTLRFYPARDIDQADVTRDLAAIVITHAHLDHFHPATLACFPKHVPLLVPPDAYLLEQAERLGFQHVVALSPWSEFALRNARLIATPSDFEWDELGLVVASDDSSYWHMSDSIVTPEVGARLRRDFGPVSLVSVKFQPLRTLIGHQRGMSALMLDRNELVDAFEAACAAEPSTIFPYSFGFAFNGEHSWANRHVGPYTADQIRRLFERRLDGASRVTTVNPGDVFEIDGRTVVQRQHAALGVRAKPSVAPEPWEPIDRTTLLGLSDPTTADDLQRELEDLLVRGAFPWVLAHRTDETGLFDAYHRYQAVWQGVVHLGGNARLHYAIDFRPEVPLFYLQRQHPDANVFTHISGRCLHAILQRDAGAELLWMAGGYRQYEKLLLVRDGRFQEPPVTGWELLEQLPDPICHYLRKVGTSRLVPAEAPSDTEALREAAVG